MSETPPPEKAEPEKKLPPAIAAAQAALALYKSQHNPDAATLAAISRALPAYAQNYHRAHGTVPESAALLQLAISGPDALKQANLALPTPSISQALTYESALAQLAKPKQKWRKRLLPKLSWSGLITPKLPTPENPERAAANAALWQKRVRQAPPLGLEYLPPFGFRPAEFAQIKNALMQEGAGEIPAAQLAYQGQRLFNTAERCWQYLSKHGSLEHERPLTHLLSSIMTPPADISLVAWADALLKHGPSLAPYVIYADRVPQPGDSLKATRQLVAPHIYIGGQEQPLAAALAYEYRYKQSDFERVLTALDNYEKSGTKAEKDIPDLRIDGKDFGLNDYVFYRLKEGDIRGLFLGAMVHCCQHMASTGSKPALHGFNSEHGGFYVIEHKQHKNIIGMSWVWRGQKGELVFDSLEHLGKRIQRHQWQAICKAVANRLEQDNPLNVTKIMVGVIGKAPVLMARPALLPAKPRDYPHAKRDSWIQYYLGNVKGAKVGRAPKAKLTAKL